MEQGPDSRYIPSFPLTGVQYFQTFQMAITIPREQWFLRAYDLTNNNNNLSVSTRGQIRKEVRNIQKCNI